MLPKFKYHPNPIATGSIEQAENVCECCGLARGYIYMGPVHAAQNLDKALCPWCIADGSAHKKFRADFIGLDGIGGFGEWDDVPEEVLKEVAHCTPGFCGWKPERWWTHCGDAAEYLGPAGWKEVLRFGDELMAALKADTGFEGAEWKEYFESLDLNRGPTAYVFRCIHCGKLGGYSDYR
jgi:hypothetical protein